jgi:WD40 repeat protein
MDLATGRIRREVGTGHEPPATWTATSTDGRRVATTADDGTLRLWDGTHAHLQLRVGLPEADPVTATFLAGDRDLLLTTRDGGIYRWDTSPGYTENFACALAGRSMTRAEWMAYVGKRPYARNCARLDTFYDNPTRIDVGDVNHVGPNKH